jgi:hypothetical protein
VLLREERRRSLYDGKIVAAYLAGTVSGAIVTALAAWLLGGFTEPLNDGWRLALLAGGAVFIWLCKHGPLVGVVVLPETRRQIPAEVFGGSLLRGAYRFGFELASGVRTYAGTAAPYVLLLTILLIRPTIAQALLIGAGFGLGRAVPLIVRLIQTGTSSARTFWRRISPVTQTLATLLVLLGGMSLV